MLLRELDLIDEIKFVHPKDMQDGAIPITGRDIITNLPYNPACHLAFDHHASEMLRSGPRRAANHVILDPSGWTLLNFLMDSRTGLGRFRSFRISNYELMMQLIDECRDHAIDDVLRLPDVQERIELYRAHREPFAEQIRRCTSVHGKLGVLDLRGEATIYAGNRFMIYALFPQIQISCHVLWGLQRQNTVFAIGKSILDRGSTVNVGAVCLGHGGGGHEAAGTFQIANDQAQAVLAELIPVLGA